MSKFKCIHEGSCYSPIACSVFGYCRQRNQDGKGMDKAEVARRKLESDNEIKDNQNG